MVTISTRLPQDSHETQKSMGDLWLSLSEDCVKKARKEYSALRGAEMQDYVDQGSLWLRDKGLLWKEVTEKSRNEIPHPSCVMVKLDTLRLTWRSQNSISSEKSTHSRKRKLSDGKILYYIHQNILNEPFPSEYI